MSTTEEKLDSVLASLKDIKQENSDGQKELKWRLDKLAKFDSVFFKSRLEVLISLC